MFCFCLFLQYLVSFLVCNHLDGKESTSCFTLIVFLVSCDCKCSVALPHGAGDSFAVCDWCIS